MKQQIGVLVVAIGLVIGLAPSAQATPVLQGSTVGNVGTEFGCIDAYCVAFRDSGCPEAMAQAVGVTASIVDVSGHIGERLTFTWSDAGTQLWDAGLGAAGQPFEQMMFYVISSCAVSTPSPTAPLPAYLPVAFTLTTDPSLRSASYVIPNGAKWLVAEPMQTAGAVHWSAS